MKYYWLCILLLAFCLLSATLTPQIAQIPLPVNPDILHGTLENGIKYYIVQNAKPANRAELRLYVDAGSILEDEDQLGLAHFCEHMAFNGTTHFAKSEVVDYLASIGMGFANGLNAMTSYDFTMYQLKIPTDNRDQLEKGFLILSDMAHLVSFDEDELERERGVIIEEWRMGQDASSRVRDKISEVAFAGSRYATRSPIGTYESLTTFGRDEIVRFYNDWYRPDLQTVLVVGDLPKEEALELVTEYFGKIPVHPNPRPREVFSVPEHPEARAVVATDPEYQYSSIDASWSREHSQYQTLGDFYQNLHELLFFSMLNNRFEELSNSEAPPFSLAYGYSGTMMKGLAQTTLSAYTGEGKNRTALNVLLSEAERVRRHGFLPSEFERAKVELIRKLEADVEKSSTMDSGALVWGFIGTLMHDNTYMSPQGILELTMQFLDGVELENINSLVDDYITEDNLTISYTSFDKEGSVHPSTIELLDVYNEVLASEIEPYEDLVVEAPLMEKAPKAGKITKRKTHKASGIQEWTLSNGAKVYSKKTDFKADEVLFSANSKGGYSRYPQQMIYDAQNLGSYLGSSGVGEFDISSLNRVLSGKIANLNFNVALYEEGLYGGASPRDLQTLFELIYLNATQPRFDAKAFNSFITRMKPWYENQMNSPEKAFSDSLGWLMFDKHPMRKPFNMEDLNNLSLQNMETIFKDRFGNFGDFNFYFVGNFDEKLLEEYCKTYLASLPAKKKKDKQIDKGIRFFGGHKSASFAKGSSESANVSHVSTGKYVNTTDNKVAINAMINVLNEKLRENIREDMSGVYAIQAWQEYMYFPKDEYYISLWMSCSPARVDELNDAIFAVIDSVRTGNYDERYIVSSKAVLEKRHEESISQNRYWLNNMSSNVINGKPLDSFLNNPKRYAKINRKLINDAAKKYLDFGKNKLSIIMVPAGKTP